MRTGVCIEISPVDRRRLEAVIRNRNSPEKNLWRTRIIGLTDADASTKAIMREIGKAKTCVGRWQERFAEDGVARLLRDKTQPSRVPPLDPAVVDRVVSLTLDDPLTPPHQINKSVSRRQ